MAVQMITGPCLSCGGRGLFCCDNRVVEPTVVPDREPVAAVESTDPTVEVRLAPTFYDDHVDRGCAGGTVIRRTKRHVIVALDAYAFDDLLSDAVHYEDHRDFDGSYFGLCASARSVRDVLRRTERPADGAPRPPLQVGDVVDLRWWDGEWYDRDGTVESIDEGGRGATLAGGGGWVETNRLRRSADQTPRKD